MSGSRRGGRRSRPTPWWQRRAPSPSIEEFRVLIPDGDVERTIRINEVVRDELAAALRVSSLAAQERIDTSRLLAGPLSQTQESLALGEISPAHVRAIVDGAQRLPGSPTSIGQDDQAALQFAGACRQLQGRVLPVARRSAPAQARRAVARAVQVIDAEGAKRRRQVALGTRDVYVVEDHDGVSLLIARLSCAHAHALRAAIQAVADAAEPGALSAGERRAQALLDLVLGDPEVTATVGVTAQVEVTVSLTTLLGLAADPGVLSGGGVLGAQDARALLSDPEIRTVLHRVVTDPLDSSVLEYGRRTYTVPNALRRAVEVRDGTCRFPGCARRARRCQVDHAQAWDDGGGTDITNLGLLCVRHHQLKTHAGWAITSSEASGACTWRSPHGREYRREGGLP